MLPIKEKKTVKLPRKATEIKQIPKKQEEEKREKLFLHFLRFLIITVILTVSGFIFVAWGVYKEGWQNYFVESVYRVVPYPAVAIGYTNWVSLNDYSENVKAIRRFLESQEAASNGGKFDFSTEKGLKRLAIIKKSVLNQLIDDKITEILAKQQGITINNSELDDVTNKILNRDGKWSENITELNSLYEWKPEDFKKMVVKTLLYKQKLEDEINASGELNKTAKEKVATLEKKIAAGEDFAKLAENYSDSPSNKYGGLLPVFAREEAPKDFAEQVFQMKPGEISQPIETSDGWHFVKVERKFQEDKKDKVEVRHIVIVKEIFEDWLQKEKQKFKITVFLQPYYWHEQMGKLYFKDDSLNQLEQEWNRDYLNEKAQEADFLLNIGKNNKNISNSNSNNK